MQSDKIQLSFGARAYCRNRLAATPTSIGEASPSKTKVSSQLDSPRMFLYTFEEADIKGPEEWPDSRVRSLPKDGTPGESRGVSISFLVRSNYNIDLKFL